MAKTKEQKKERLYLYVVTKEFFAKDAKDALKKEKNERVDDVYVNNDWKKNNL
jgi:hypothetical protein